MKGFSYKGFWLLVLLQIAVLGGMIGQRMYLLRTGTPVMLECVPIDPRSLLSGDYVILRYHISELEAGSRWRRAGTKSILNRFGETFRKNQTIYVALERKTHHRFHKPVAYSGSLERLKKYYPLIIRGVVQSPWNMHIRYGLESYFVPQFQGKEIEKKIRHVHVEVMVSRSGESALRRLFVYGKEVKFR